MKPLKLISTALLITLFTSQSLAQKYMKEIATNACTCMDNEKQMSNEEYTTMFGLCMIQHALPYTKEIKKDYKIDLNSLGDDNGDAEKLGEIIALQMISICPKKLIAVTEKLKTEEGTTTTSPESTSSVALTESGTIIMVDNSSFLTITIKKENGRSSKYFVLEDIEANTDLHLLKNKKGKKINVSYIKKEFYDPKTNQFRLYNVLTSLTI